MSIKAAHVCAVTPHAAGIYESTLECVKGEINNGIDARIVDCGNRCEVGLLKRKREELKPYFKHLGVAADAAVEGALDYLKTKDEFKVEPKEKGFEDRGIVIEDAQWAIDEADILIGHSGFHGPLQNLNKPYIMCCHGRPKSSFLLEYYREYPVYSGYTRMNQDPRIRKFITFWEEHLPNLSMLINPEKLEYVPACVDLDFFKHDGETSEFPNKDNKTFNIMICDVWRKDIDPYNIVHAAHWFCKKHPEAQFHIFGCKPKQDMGPWKILLGKCQKEGTLGVIAGMVDKLDRAYRSADMMLTPHRIATRTVRESLSSGLPLVAEEGNPYTPFHAPTYDLDRFIKEMERCYKKIKQDKVSVSRRMRKSAETHFDMNQTGKEMKKIIEGVLEEWKNVDLKPVKQSFEAVVK